MLLVVIKE